MAMGITRKLGLIYPGSEANAPGSAFSTYPQIAHDNLEATAQTSGELLNPGSITSTNVHPIELAPGITRVGIRAKVDDGMTTVTTSPVVRLYSCLYDPNIVAAAANKFRRIDNVDWAGAGLTLTMVASGSGMHTDGTYFYSDEAALAGHDCLGGRFVVVACETAGNVGVATAIEVEVFGIN